MLEQNCGEPELFASCGRLDWAAVSVLLPAYSGASTVTAMMIGAV